MLVVVNPAERGSQEVSIPMVERSWREAHTTGAAAQTEDGVAPSSAPEVQFEVVYVRSTAEAAKAIQGALLQLRCDSTNPLTSPVTAASCEQNEGCVQLQSGSPSSDIQELQNRLPGVR